MPKKSTPTFSNQLLNWFAEHGRHTLPWQEPDPYKVWLSEIMLQQTQVVTVIPYFERFITALPTIKALAEAPIDQVLHLWTGLGYYARGRNLHKAAQMIQNQHQGLFPDNFDQVVALPGIGPSTASAILSLAFNQRFAILDGNVKRILARLYRIDSWPNNPKIQNQLWDLARNLLPNAEAQSILSCSKACAKSSSAVYKPVHEPRDKHTTQLQLKRHRAYSDYTQAIMDLGALICTPKKPNCEHCPVNNHCQAYHTGDVSRYPIAKPKSNKPTRVSELLLLQNQNQQILLEQRPNKGIWGGLWSLPELTDQTKQSIPNDQLLELSEIKHSFTHYHLRIKPFLLTLKQDQLEQLDLSQFSRQNTHWYSANCNTSKIGLAAPIKKLIDNIPTKSIQRSLIL